MSLVKFVTYKIFVSHLTIVASVICKQNCRFGYASVKRIVAWFDRKVSKDVKILDIGCGNGVTLIELVRTVSLVAKVLCILACSHLNAICTILQP